MVPLGRVLVEVVEPHAVEHHSSLTGAEDVLVGARWAVSKAGENHAFLVTLPDVKRSYTFVTKRCVEMVNDKYRGREGYGRWIHTSVCCHAV